MIRVVAALSLAVLAVASCSGSAGEPELEPETTPPPTTVAPAAEALEIHTTGDWRPTFTGDQANAEGYGGIGNELRRRLRGDDLTVVNLACAVTAGDSPPPEGSTRCRPEDVAGLARDGVDVVTIANAEVLDAGPEAVAATRAAVAEAGLEAVGPGLEPVTLAVAGNTVAVLALSRRGPEPVLRRDAVAAVEQAAAGADVVIVSADWGTPGARAARPEDVAYAAKLVEAGADVVAGHGAARLHAFIGDGASAVFSGLGRFVWPVADPASAEADTALGWASVEDGTVTEACLLGLSIEPVGRPRLDHRNDTCTDDL